MSSKRTFEEISRWTWRPTHDNTPSLIEIQTGAMLRIASAIERIEKMVYDETPAGKEEAKAEAEEQAKNKKYWEMVRVIEGWVVSKSSPPPKGVTADRLASWWLNIHPHEADYTSRESWDAVLARGRRELYGFGQQRERLVGEWIEAVFGEDSSA